MEENDTLNYEEALKMLTPSEIRVLDQVKKGYPNKIIAKNLGISIRTVHAHRNKICKKLGVKGRGGLTRWILKAKN